MTAPTTPAEGPQHPSTQAEAEALVRHHWLPVHLGAMVHGPVLLLTALAPPDGVHVKAPPAGSWMLEQGGEAGKTVVFVWRGPGFGFWRVTQPGLLPRDPTPLPPFPSTRAEAEACVREQLAHGSLGAPGTLLVLWRGESGAPRLWDLGADSPRAVPGRVVVLVPSNEASGEHRFEFAPRSGA